MKPGHRHEDSSALAAKALAWGTFWAVTGIGAMTFTIFKILGISNVSYERWGSDLGYVFY